MRCLSVEVGEGTCYCFSLYSFGLFCSTFFLFFCLPFCVAEGREPQCQSFVRLLVAFEPFQGCHFSIRGLETGFVVIVIHGVSFSSSIRSFCCVFLDFQVWIRGRECGDKVPFFQTWCDCESAFFPTRGQLWSFNEGYEQNETGDMDLRTLI